MRLHVLSDLHLEFAPFASPEVEADAVVLAGDTHFGVRGVAWAAQAFGGPTVVVTHHAPSLRSVAPSLAADELSAAYASALDEVVASSGAAYWIHGHTHHNVRYQIGETCVLSNQRGYPDEPVEGFDPALVLHL